MKILKHERAVAVDIDDTLVMWKGQSYTPNQKNIDSVIRHSKRGHYVTVWSQGGWEWALKVVKELGLEPYVNEIRTKFSWYLDDKPADKWMDRYYYHDTDKEKDHDVGENREAARTHKTVLKVGNSPAGSNSLSDSVLPIKDSLVKIAGSPSGSGKESCCNHGESA